MPRTFDVVCPTGLSVTIREFVVADEDLLSNPKSIKSGAAVTDLLNAITNRVNDPGPYVISKAGIDWKNVLQGDRMVALLKNRIFTWGEELDFDLPCQRCQQKVTNTFDLTQLVIKKLPETSRPHVMGSGTPPLMTTLPVSGAKVSFRLLRGVDDRALSRLAKQKKDTRSSAYLLYRTLDVEGVNQAEWGRWYRELSAKDASFLRRQFDEADCGVDQEADFTCEECNHTWREDVQFRADFLFPKYRAKSISND
jgi:hypothetical protein